MLFNITSLFKLFDGILNYFNAFVSIFKV